MCVSILKEIVQQFYFFYAIQYNMIINHLSRHPNFLSLFYLRFVT